MSFNKSLLLLFVGFLLVFCFLKSDAAEDKNLVLYLSFDEGNGNAVKDLSGSRNDGVINGKVKWVNGKENNALEFGVMRLSTLKCKILIVCILARNHSHTWHGSTPKKSVLISLS